MNYFFSYHAYRHTDRHTHTQTHADEYSIVAVNKPQPLLIQTGLKYATYFCSTLRLTGCNLYKFVTFTNSK